MEKQLIGRRPSGLFCALAIAGALVLGTPLTGCDRLPIGLTNAKNIQQAPSSFEGQEVKLRGTVREIIKLPLIDLKGYRIQDASGEAMVVTKGTEPGEGEEIIVLGKVENPLIIGGQSPGAVIQETRRLPVGMLGVAWGYNAK